ncbi:heat- and acid-stable phosphoprotein [Phlyctochytrium planicorne]|nr:heat- and acid-stable phosphoprotein [Phlyctochytrium planicorne]
MSSFQKKKLNKTKRGGPRHFSNPSWDEPRDTEERDSSDEDSNDEEETPKPRSATNNNNNNKNKKAYGRSEDTSSEEEDSEPDVLPKPKDYGKPPPEPEPVEAFQSSNTNRQATKNLKASDLATSENVPMSRRQREEMEKERAKAAFWKAQMEGKTDQARADLARLAIIKKQREEAARKRAEEQAGMHVPSLSLHQNTNLGFKAKLVQLRQKQPV